MLLDRLANTPPGDPLMTGLLGMIDRLLLQQIQRCESPQIADGEARAIVNSIGLLVGFRTDIEEQWRKQLNRRAMEEAKQKAAERHR